MAATRCVPALHGDREREIISSSTNMCLFPEETAWHSLLHKEWRCPGCREMRTATPASRTESRLKRASPPPARTRAQGASLNAPWCKAPTVPPFHLKSSKGCNFYCPESFLGNVLRQSSPRAASERMPKNRKAIERGEPEDCEDCEYPTNHTTLLAGLPAWKC